ncbi:MAG TPA: hypothetical protein VG937_05575 [Polyangiaceae bacterium]|nr:hypothetical protein [Polyangiaceae bacterium]
MSSVIGGDVDVAFAAGTLLTDATGLAASAEPTEGAALGREDVEFAEVGGVELEPFAASRSVPGAWGSPMTRKLSIRALPGKVWDAR